VLPDVELTEVMVALDAACGFSKHLLHSAGAKARSPALQGDAQSRFPSSGVV